MLLADSLQRFSPSQARSLHPAAQRHPAHYSIFAPEGEQSGLSPFTPHGCNGTSGSAHSLDVIGARLQHECELRVTQTGSLITVNPKEMDETEGKGEERLKFDRKQISQHLIRFLKIFPVVFWHSSGWGRAGGETYQTKTIYSCYHFSGWVVGFHLKALLCLHRSTMGWSCEKKKPLKEQCHERKCCFFSYRVRLPPLLLLLLDRNFIKTNNKRDRRPYAIKDD